MEHKLGKKVNFRKKFFTYGGVITLVVGVVLYLRLVVAPVVKSITEEEVRALTVSAVNSGVSETLAIIPEYTDIVTFHYDTEENVNLLKVDTLTVNRIAQNTTVAVQEKLSAWGMKGVKVPIGSLSGFMSLSGKGPDITVNVMPVGSVSAKLCSEFVESGINQTNHRIYVRIFSSVSVVLPGANNVVDCVTDVLIVDSVVVGKIPETYLNSTSTQDMMDLIP